MTWWIAVLALLAAAEISLRAYRVVRHRAPIGRLWRTTPPRLLAFESHPYALYVTRPNGDGQFPSNSLGYAGKREIPKARVPNSVRIYCVGGSTTQLHDPAQGPDSSWPAKLQDVLCARFPGVTIECINAGTGGYTSVESLIEFMLRGVDLRPDILLVYHNVNDAWTCQMVDGFKSDYSHARRRKPWKVGWVNRLPQLPWCWSYQLIRDWVMRRFGKANALLYWIADPPWTSARTVNPEAVWTFRRNITNLVAIAQRWSCIPVLIPWECDWTARQLPSSLEPHETATDVYFALLEANNEALKAIAAEDPHCSYLDVGPFRPHHFSDTIHFSPEGLSEMARRVAEGIAPLAQSVVAGQLTEAKG